MSNDQIGYCEAKCLQDMPGVYNTCVAWIKTWFQQPDLVLRGEVWRRGGQLLMNNNNFPQPLSHTLYTSDLLFRTLLCKIYFST